MDAKRRRRNQEEGLCDCIIPITRLWGVATAIVMCGVGVDVATHGYTGGFFVIAASILVFFLEIIWAITMLLQVCLRGEYTRGFHCWERITWLGGWKLAPPYVAIGVALIVWPQGLWLSPVAGGQLIVLAVLHLLQIFRTTPQGQHDTLLPQHIPEADSFEKYEDITEILDDTLPGPVHHVNLEEDDPLEM